MLNQAFRTGLKKNKKGTAGRTSKVLQCWVLGAGEKEILWALQVLLVQLPILRAILGFCFISLGCSRPVKYPLSTQRAGRWNLHFAGLSSRNQMCSGPSRWECTEERDLLAVLRFFLEPWAGVARMFYLQCYLSGFGLVL